jgi:hypothetical protein
VGAEGEVRFFRQMTRQIVGLDEIRKFAKLFNVFPGSDLDSRSPEAVSKREVKRPRREGRAINY